MPQRLKGKIAIVTGAGGAIGFDIAREFCEQGASVAVVDLNFDAAQETTTKITSGGGVCFPLQVDISQEDQVQRMVEQTVEKFGKLDILVNNAVMFLFGDATSVTSSDWDKILSVNIRGSALCLKYAALQMRKQGHGGSIINIGSISSFVAQEAFVPYNTTKGALLQLTRCAAMDLGKDNIRVNIVCPGCIDTPATDKHAKSLGVTRESLVDGMLEKHFIKRMGTGRDVAMACVFLASDESTFITATPLMVDGGYVAH